MDIQSRFGNILVATDFSLSCKSALDTAIDLCIKHQAVLHLIHVVEDRKLSLDNKEEIPQEIRNEIDQARRSQLYNLYELIMKNHGIRVKIHMPKGIPYEEICKLASEMPIDLVVVGNGDSSSNDHSIGITKHNVIKNSIKPVLVVPASSPIPACKEVLFPVRPNQQIFARYVLVEKLLKDAPAAFQLVVLRKDINEPQGPYKFELGKMINSMIGKGITCVKEVYTCPDFAAKILEISNTSNVGLIAINASLSLKRSQFFLDSYTQKIISNSKMPVLCFPSSADIKYTKGNNKVSTARI